MNCSREMLCAALGNALLVPVARGVVFQIEGAEIATQPEVGRLVQRSGRIHFGSLYVPPPFIAFDDSFKVTSPLISSALDIFAFDMLTLNVDRRVGNPNLLFDGLKMTAIDHELAFSVGLPQMQRSEAFKFRDSFISKNHLFRLTLSDKVNNNSFDSFVSRVAGLEIDEIDDWILSLPNEWQDETDLVQIRRRLATAIQDPEGLCKGLLEVFA